MQSMFPRQKINPKVSKWIDPFFHMYYQYLFHMSSAPESWKEKFAMAIEQCEKAIAAIEMGLKKLHEDYIAMLQNETISFTSFWNYVKEMDFARTFLQSTIGETEDAYKNGFAQIHEEIKLIHLELQMAKNDFSCARDQCPHTIKMFDILFSLMLIPDNSDPFIF